MTHACCCCKIEPNFLQIFKKILDWIFPQLYRSTLLLLKPADFISWWADRSEMLWSEFWRSPVAHMARCAVFLKHLSGLCPWGWPQRMKYSWLEQKLVWEDPHTRDVSSRSHIMCSFSGTKLSHQAHWKNLSGPAQPAFEMTSFTCPRPLTILLWCFICSSVKHFELMCINCTT